ncbi:hypothetical protein GMMP1_570100 [Candidatus Magnetomoraceae bacterium gMMP-1]
MKNQNSNKDIAKDNKVKDSNELSEQESIKKSIQIEPKQDYIKRSDRVKKDEIKLKEQKLMSAITLSKLVVIASIALIAGWMLSSFILLVYFGGKLDDALKILTAVIPFWSTITGTVLGYLFGKDK